MQLNLFKSVYTRETSKMSKLACVEICAGAGGQALGYEMADFEHVCLAEIDRHACATLQSNRPAWNVIAGDVANLDGRGFKGIDLLAGGVPCPPFSVAGKQLGKSDERNLFPEVFRLVDECRPRAVMIENVRGLLDASFAEYRRQIDVQFKKFGFVTGWRLLNASDFGVPQLRPRVVLIALKAADTIHFEWPEPIPEPPKTVGETILDLMRENGWKKATEWAISANSIAPTLVGGSHKHGGPDLGPTRARKAWAALRC